MTARPTAAARFTAGCIALFALFARACAEPDCPTSTPPGPSDGHAWRRALGATALILAAPTAILPLIPASAAKGDRVQKTLVAFAIGGLLGDVFLHSMPHLLSPLDEHHHHDEHDAHEKEHDHDGHDHDEHDHDAHEHDAHEHDAHEHDAHDHDAHDHDEHDHRTRPTSRFPAESPGTDY